MKKNIWSALCCMALLAGCQQAEEIENADELRMSIEASIGKQDVASRYSGETPNEAEFADGDKIGLSVNGGTFVKWTYENEEWNATSSVNWEDKTTGHTFYAFYPYADNATMGSVPMPNLLGQDGTMESVATYDFLATTKTQSYGSNGIVSFTGKDASFKHVSSLVTVTLKNEGDLVDATIKGISIAGKDILATSTYSFAVTGEDASPVKVNTTDGTADDLLKITSSPENVPLTTGKTYYFVLNAGTVDLSVATITVQYEKGEKNYTARHTGLGKDGKNSFERGNRYNYTLKIVGGELIITGNTIADWGTGITMEDIVINGSEDSGSSGGDE